MALLRTVIVVNPKSQNGALGRRWPDLVVILRRELGSFEEVHTKGPGDATRLTREALANGATCVVAMGGDGTINEVVNGFFPSTGGGITGDLSAHDDAPALGILPFGTGGDFRKTLHLPTDIARAAQIIRAGHRRLIDIGKVSYATRNGHNEIRYFANVASFGISGVVDRLVNQSSKRLGGRISFMLSTVRASMEYNNQRVHLQFDDDPNDTVDLTINTVAVANGRYFGGGMYIAPEALLDDGYFDVVAVGDMGLGDFVIHGRRLYRGTHLTLDKVSHRRARIIRAEPVVAGDQVELDIDGETPGILPATFTILPAAFPVIAPKG